MAWCAGGGGSTNSFVQSLEAVSNHSERITPWPQGEERRATTERYAELGAALAEAEGHLADEAAHEHIEALESQLAAALREVTQGILRTL